MLFRSRLLVIITESALLWPLTFDNLLLVIRGGHRKQTVLLQRADLLENKSHAASLFGDGSASRRCHLELQIGEADD